jgi:hypothetical protein
MWCQKCRADVAAMASSDNERIFCTACGTELSRMAASAPEESSTAAGSGRSLRDPRDLLARWAREDALESLDIAPPIPRETTGRKPVLRFDGSHPVVASPPPNFLERTVAANPSAAPHAPVEKLPPATSDIIIHQAHGPNAPHFLPAPVSLADKSSRWVTLAGQLFAYLGVGGLTIGTVLVLMGYFGGPASYATTGWLITTAGQMLLFLGVVTLVSGGMEQTTQEVARRIDTLGERLVRIEQAAWSGKADSRSDPGEPGT